MTTGRIWAVVGLAWVLLAWWLTGRFVPLPWWQVVIMGGGVALQLPPYLASRALGSSAPPARVWIGRWALVFFLADFAQLAISELVGTTLWFLLAATPIEDG